MENPISIKNLSEKYPDLYGYSTLRKFYSEGKLVSAKKIGNTIVIDEGVELLNLEALKKETKLGRPFTKNKSSQ